MKERKINLLLMLLVMLSLVIIKTNVARAYVIDGYLLDDWGIDLSKATSAGHLNSGENFPSGGFDIDAITDDKADSSSGWLHVGPGWTYNNYFDVEAIYFDNDGANAYIAIIQGLPKEGVKIQGNPWLLPGDIAIDADNDMGTGDYGFEYGLSISDGQLYSVSSWKNSIYPKYGIVSDPWAINVGTVINSVNFVYSGNQNTHYVLEAAIPLAYLGLSAGHGDTERNLRVHWTQECGNDYLTLNADVNPVVTPEPASLILLGSGLLGLIGTFLRKRFQEAKRIFDIIASLIGIVITFPLMLILGGLIRLDSRGEILYKQTRVGENRREKRNRRLNSLFNGVEQRNTERREESSLGRLFTMYKLRTMKMDAESGTGPVWATEDDPRVTRLGKFLRKFHLDEIPQLINILRGEMSLIGPRPERPKIIDSFNGDIPNYTRRLRVKPGITGLAQVRYRYDESLDDVKNKLRYDLLYIRKMCWTWDIRVIFLTIIKMLTGKTAR